MKTFLAALFLIGTLAACASDGSAPTPAQTVFDIRAGYGIALSGMATYSSLPRCGPMVPKVCSDQGVVDQLRKADTAAKTALDAAQSQVVNYPTIDATAAIAAARNATDAVSEILQQYNIGG